MEVTSAYSKQMMPGIIQGRVRIKAEINSDLNGFERTQIHFDFLFFMSFMINFSCSSGYVVFNFKNKIQKTMPWVNGFEAD